MEHSFASIGRKLKNNTFAVPPAISCSAVNIAADVPHKAYLRLFSIFGSALEGIDHNRLGANVMRRK